MEEVLYSVVFFVFMFVTSELFNVTFWSGNRVLEGAACVGPYKVGRRPGGSRGNTLHAISMELVDVVTLGGGLELFKGDTVYLVTEGTGEDF